MREATTLDPAQTLDRSTRGLGFWSAVAVTASVAAFGLSLLFGLPIAVSFVAAFLLAPSFVTLMVSLHYHTPPERRPWTHLGLTFAILYAGLCAAAYFVQLAVVSGNPLRMSADALALFAFTPGSAVFAQDMLGYAFLCLATLAAAPVFVGGRLERWLKGVSIAHGLLFAPTLVMTILFPYLAGGPGSSGSDRIGTLVLLGWCIIFLPIPILLAVRFRRS